MFENNQACTENGTLGIRDGECAKLESEEAYFILCCCWRNLSNCIYDPRAKSSAETNKKIWLELAKSQNPEVALRVESDHFSNRNIQWSYHNFIYSFPKKTVEGDIILGSNEPRYYCSQLLSYSDSDITTPSSANWKKIQVEQLPLRYRFCKFTITVHFQSGTAKRFVRVYNSYTALNYSISLISFIFMIEKETNILSIINESLSCFLQLLIMDNRSLAKNELKIAK
uniref:Uncharacterized protein n=1 Tax=Elaeophora elaphi TaxID=1147741 RepID=A0A0R3RGC2_9BILA